MMPALAAQTCVSHRTNAQSRIKVLIVEKSAVSGKLTEHWLSGNDDLDVVGLAVNGKEAIQLAQRYQPHIILLDVEMPVMDGLTALPKILKASPFGRVIMASTLTRRGGETTLRALSAGACDYLAKPDPSQFESDADYKRDLLFKVRMLGGKSRLRKIPHSKSHKDALPEGTLPHQGSLEPFTETLTTPQAIFIGASTGGPEALCVVVAGLAGKINVPVLMTQHMPALFTRILAEHLCKQTGALVIEAQDDMLCEAGVFYLAPGDFHMTVALSGGGLRISLNKDDHENFCRPAVDPLFRSASNALGEAALGVILTGMGQDGREGAKAMVGKGSLLIAQDEKTSVAWGMPGAVVKAGIATSQKSVNDIAPSILSIMQGAHP